MQVTDPSAPLTFVGCHPECRHVSTYTKVQPQVQVQEKLYKFKGPESGAITVKKGSRVSRPQQGCHYQTLHGRE